MDLKLVQKWKREAIIFQDWISDHCSTRIWDHFDYKKDEKSLYGKIAGSLFREPKTQDDYGLSTNENELVIDIISKIKSHSFYRNSCNMALIFVHMLNRDGQSDNIPLFRVYKHDVNPKLKDGIKIKKDFYVTSSSIFIDSFGRVYNNWEDFLETNLYYCHICVPTNGFYSGQQNYQFIDRSDIDWYGENLDKVAVTPLIGTAIGGLATLIPPIAPIGATVLAVSNTAAILSSIHSLRRNVNNLYDRYQHEQTISIFDRQVRQQWCMCIGPIVSLATFGSAKMITSGVQTGNAVSSTTLRVCNGLKFGSLGISFVGIGDQVYHMYSEEGVTVKNTLNLMTQALLLSHSVITFTSAEAILQEAQNENISSFKRFLGAKDGRKIDLMERKLIEKHGSIIGKQEFIKKLNSIDNLQSHLAKYKVLNGKLTEATPRIEVKSPSTGNPKDSLHTKNLQTGSVTKQGFKTQSPIVSNRELTEATPRIEVKSLSTGNPQIENISSFKSSLGAKDVKKLDLMERQFIEKHGSIIGKQEFSKELKSIDNLQSHLAKYKVLNGKLTEATPRIEVKPSSTENPKVLLHTTNFQTGSFTVQEFKTHSPIVSNRELTEATPRIEVKPSSTENPKVLLHTTNFQTGSVTVQEFKTHSPIAIKPILQPSFFDAKNIRNNIHSTFKMIPFTQKMPQVLKIIDDVMFEQRKGMIEFKSLDQIIKRCDEYFKNFITNMRIDNPNPTLDPTTDVISHYEKTLNEQLKLNSNQEFKQFLSNLIKESKDDPFVMTEFDRNISYDIVDEMEGCEIDDELKNWTMYDYTAISCSYQIEEYYTNTIYLFDSGYNSILAYNKNTDIYKLFEFNIEGENNKASKDDPFVMAEFVQNNISYDIVDETEGCLVEDELRNWTMYDYTAISCSYQIKECSNTIYLFDTGNNSILAYNENTDIYKLFEFNNEGESTGYSLF